MNLSETAQLLSQMAAFDRRTIGDADVIAWQAALYDVTLPNARAAVIEHVRNKPGVWIEPGHIRIEVKRIRQLALQNTALPLPKADPDDTVAYLAEQRANIKAIADAAGSEYDGITQLPQLARGASAPDVDYAAIAARRGPEVRQALVDALTVRDGRGLDAEALRRAEPQPNEDQQQTQGVNE